MSRRHKSKAVPALVVGVVGAVLALSACGGSLSYDENAVIPADVWPTLDGVTVVSSDGFTGIDCCEGPQTGGRTFQLATSVAAANAIDFVASGLTDAGWEPYRCTHQTVCRQNDGMVAVFSKPRAAERKHGVEVSVKLVRDS